MDKLKELIADLRNLCTNDPIMQHRIVKVLDQVVEVLDEKKDECTDEDGESCGCGGERRCE